MLNSWWATRAKKQPSILHESRLAWKQELSSFEKIVACFIFGQIMSLVGDLLGLKQFFNAKSFFPDDDTGDEEESPIPFFDIDTHTKAIKPHKPLIKFINDIKQLKTNRENR